MAVPNFSYNSREVNFTSPASIQRTGRYGSDSIGDEIPLMISDDGFETDENDLLMSPRRGRGVGNSAFRKSSKREGCSDCCNSLFDRCRRKREYQARTVWIGQPTSQKFPANRIRNQKYHLITFVPLVLYNQFKYFLNFYFLLMALSQFIPNIRVGYLYTYWLPLIFVICVTMLREFIDELRRYSRDKELNSARYRALTRDGVVEVSSSNIKVGDLIYVDKNQRVPADIIFLRTTERSGSCFIRTDQLDGETDWKLRVAVGSTQHLQSDKNLFDIAAQVFAEKPQKDIHSFIGTFTRTDAMAAEEPLDIDNTLWSGTVVASGTALGVVVYTGSETRSVMNTSQPSNKVGLLDLDVNYLTKVLFVATVILSLTLMILKGFSGPWYRYFIRFILLFAYIIPLSLIVNLDMGKIVYSMFIARDKKIPGTVVRTTTIPEELGRISYLLSDKTGTLTRNEMIFQRLHIGSVSFGLDSMDDVIVKLKKAYLQQKEKGKPASKVCRTELSKIIESVKAIALCHNVTPVYERVDGMVEDSDDVEADQQSHQEVTYQASSPDEVALVKWTESVGLKLVKRDLDSMTLSTPLDRLANYRILQLFPFTSETKRMGIIVKEEETGEIVFYMKGADAVMQTIVQYGHWLDEECGNMAREGLRTLVVAKKTLSEDTYLDFENRYHQAKMSIQDRPAKVAAVIESLERDMELLCLTGVEDRLQEDVRPTLELLRNAGIKIWMLTGDKLETATCIAKSSCLVGRMQDIHQFRMISGRTEAHLELNAFRRKTDCALVITGGSLQVCLKYYVHEFVELACQCPAVVVCRCSPTQKADIVKLLKTYTKKRTCAIGDGGNDVSMIQAADTGVGIEGKEGKQASLAADFSITQFSHLSRLLLVHGRNSYKRSSALSQFIIHRGLIISTMQAIFSAVFYFASVSLFPSMLLVGYSTVYTMLPVFSLVLDKDVSAEIAMTYPELYKELVKGRSLSLKTFFIWVLISMYQGSILMFGTMWLFDEEFLHVVAITFTSLLLTELIMVAITIRTWHWAMVVAELLSLIIYITSLVVLPTIFDEEFLTSTDFMWKVVAITSISCIPLYILKLLSKKFSPPSYSKLT